MTGSSPFSKRCDYADKATEVTTADEDHLAKVGIIRTSALSRLCRCRHNLDNGSSFVSKQLLRALAILGVRLVHSRPGRPQGRGKT